MVRCHMHDKVRFAYIIWAFRIFQYESGVLLNEYASYFANMSGKLNGTAESMPPKIVARLE